MKNGLNYGPVLITKGPHKGEIGSIDVDVLLNQLKIHKAESYENIKRILTRNGYRRHPEKYFTF